MGRNDRRKHGHEATNEVVTLHGRVTRVFFASDTFAAGQLVCDDTGDRVRFAGQVVVREDDVVSITGRWIEDPKWGWQVKVESFRYVQPIDRAGLIEFLTRSIAFKGIGPSRAKSLVDAAGSDFEVALGDIAGLAARAKIPVEVVSAVADEWHSKRDANLVMAELARWGISPTRAAKLFAKFGPGVTRTIEENPYWLIGRVPQYGFLTVDKIALATGTPKTSRSRCRAAIVHALKEETSDGHTWTELATLRTKSLILLSYDEIESDQIVDATIQDMAAEREIVSLEIASMPGCHAVWLRGIYEAEVAVSKRIVDAGAQASTSQTEAAFGAADAKRLEPRLNDEQAEAVARALHFRFSVVTGGAGTGKTFTVKTIMRGFKIRGKSIALCAPTGKAAKRLSESVDHPAQTIHRLLEPKVDINGDGETKFRFTRDDSNPLPFDAIVIDEVSMVDIPLFAKLFRAIDWDRTQVVLVGDHNQLPPVGPGAVLRDVVGRPGLCPVTNFTHIMRQAGVLKHNVSAILDGDVEPTHDVEQTDEAKVLRSIGPWYVIDKSDDAVAARDMVMRCVTTLDRWTIEDPLHPDGRRPVDPVWDAQVLAPMKKGPIGVDELNGLMQIWAQARLGRKLERPAREGAHAPIGPDDKVMCIRNNYGVDVMNGTVGRVIDRVEKNDELPRNVVMEGNDHDPNDPNPPLAPSKGLLIDFDERPVFVTGEDVNDIVLAYAMTVHKSQGSEFPIALFVCHRAHKIMLHRGLLYTAVSRARRTAVIVGDRWGHKAAATTVASDARRTLFALASTASEVADLCRAL